MATRTRFALIIPVILLAGCAEDSEPQRGVEYLDSGTLCVHSPDGSAKLFEGPQQFESGDRLVVTVQVPECLSSSCDVNRVAECSVARIADVLEVTSYLGFDEADGEPCTMDCGRLTATCQSDPLDQGHYRIHFGGDSHPFSVPSTLNDGCL